MIIIVKTNLLELMHLFINNQTLTLFFDIHMNNLLKLEAILFTNNAKIFL